MRQFSGELGASVKYQSRKLESLVLALGTWRQQDQGHHSWLHSELEAGQG